jgi:uncharacterized repeat protein (TIGR03806 family)
MHLRALSAVVFIVVVACTAKRNETVPVVAEEMPLPGPAQYAVLGKEKLSDYNFFEQPLRQLQPTNRVYPYELNSPLFSDYAYKKRFIYLPPGTSATYHPHDVFAFPEGTVIIKNFYYPADFRQPDSNLLLLETRLLILEGTQWKALTYVWNEAQTEAYLHIAGKTRTVQWVHYDGSVRQVDYAIPNLNQCKGCHLRGNNIAPIGTLARQLNKTVGGRNQLQVLAELGALKNLPPLPDIPHLPDYADPAAPLDARARAWLEVNCAHCHRPDGPARNSGLHLTADVTRPFELGIGKPPVAAGRGSGNLRYDIVPGQPQQSILYYRIASTDPEIMMPELGKKLVHEEGVALIRDWIASLKP